MREKRCGRLFPEPLLVDLREFAGRLDGAEAGIDALEELRIPLFDGNAEVLFGERNGERKYAPFARDRSVVVVRRNVVDDGVDALVSEFKEAFVQLVENPDAGVRNLSRGFFARGADGDGEELPFKVFGGADRRVVDVDDDAEARNVVAVGEVDALRTLRRNRDVVDRDVDVAGLQGGNEAVEGNVADFDIEAFSFPDRADHVDVEADILTGRGIAGPEGRVGRIHAGDKEGLRFCCG